MKLVQVLVLSLSLVAIPSSTSATVAAADVKSAGCIFSDAVCNDQEICFDDSLFGQCVPIDATQDELESLESFEDITEHDKSLLTVELEGLLEAGYKWRDVYTQCVIQNSLVAIKQRADFDVALCDDFLAVNPPPAFDLADEAMAADSDEDDPNDFDEQQRLIDQDNDDSVEQMEEIPEGPGLLGNEVAGYGQVLNTVVPKKMIRRDWTFPLEAPQSGEDNNSDDLDEDDEDLDEAPADEEGSILIDPAEAAGFLPYLSHGGDDEDPSEGDIIIPLDMFVPQDELEGEPLSREEFDRATFMAARDALTNGGVFLPAEAEDSSASVEDDEDDLLGHPAPPAMPEVYWPSQDYEDYYLDVPTNDVRKMRKRNDNNNDVMLVPEDDADYPFYDYIMPSSEEEEEEEAVPAGRGTVPLLVTGGLESSLFNRNERLDVKKPGPFFPNSANNFFLDKLLSNDYDDVAEGKAKNKTQNDTKSSGESNSSDDVGQVEYEMPLLAPSKDKRVLTIQDRPEFPDDAEEALEAVSAVPSFVHIGFKKRFDTYNQGSNLIRYLAEEFGLPEKALTDRKIESQHVQFHVRPNPLNVDAVEMAKRLDTDGDLKDRIGNDMGVSISRAAAGHRNDDVSKALSGSWLSSPSQMVLAATLMSSVVALTLLAAVVLFIKRSTSRVEKLRQQEKGKAQEEYKQLCRDWSRSSKKFEAGRSSSGSPPASAKKVSVTATTSGPKDAAAGLNEGSNRSSTSSWSEEPNTSNMDISTGHMVLAYMEDHLKNKQRLEQEWVALCGYEAEPCATTIAFKAENKKKNRYPDKLPYDHNRIILNAMVNGNSSDYINASSVTDHDPRNPSYIVTQAPLANTVADFWQMIWEQGCVVIVMLTRLQDNGHQLCHRYWPEQGSEQYHIFEVHLVSEHIWCEDYLVRSVYLKNTRTGETRTVTQFHFRSWPADGVPTSTRALLEFRRKVNKSYRGRSCPIAVHCSDGVGRSGTYILIDMVLNRMAKGCKEIDIAAALEHIRDQRGGMVKNRQQFEFCLMAVAEEVHAILKALPQ